MLLRTLPKVFQVSTSWSTVNNRLPGHGLGNAAISGPGNLGRHSLFRQLPEEPSTSIFRDSRGRFLNFRETLPDDGDVNMSQAMRVYKEVGYDGMIIPDHAPRIEGDPRERQGVRRRAWLHPGSVQLVSQEA